MAMMTAEVRNAVAVTAATMILYLVIKFLKNAVWEPLRMRRIMAKQGVRGPPFRILLGQILETDQFAKSFPEEIPMDDLATLAPTVTPQCALYFPKYGKVFLYEWGTMSKLVVRDPEVVKELLVNNHDNLARSQLLDKLVTQVVGKGLFNLEGEKWNTERRTINPFFHQDALKSMVEAMVKGAAIEIQTWEQTVANGGGEAEIDVVPGLHDISGRIISMTAFGDDFEVGQEVFKLQCLHADETMKLFRSAAYWLVPGFRNFPTEGNRRMDLYCARVNSLLDGAIDGRREAVQKGERSTHGDDLLGCMLSAASKGRKQNTMEFNLASVFNNCKLFYFAGQDTVANSLNFGFLMLALNPEWQDRAREEVVEVFKDDQSYTANALSRLKVVGMVFNETLRLFPPATVLTRETTRDLQLTNLFIPKGMTIEIPLPALHHDRDYWGDDVGKFNPDRFANGVSEACSHKQAFIPFGFGLKSCMGPTSQQWKPRSCWPWCYDAFNSSRLPTTNTILCSP